MPKLHVVVLAAGFSSRLGQPKALARIHGKSLLRRTLMLADALKAARISVVVPPACSAYVREGSGLPITWIRNAQRGTGLSSSVRAGLYAARFASAALLLPVDLAQLRLRDLERLVFSWRATPNRVVATRLQSASGVLAGTPVILPARFYEHARAIRGDLGLRAVIGALPTGERTLHTLPSAHADVDTAQDLALARRRWP